MRVIFFGSCWPTNIGNAFVNLGAIATLRAALGERAEVHHLGGMSSYLAAREGRPGNTAPFGDWLEADYVVMGGMTQSVEHLEAAERNLRGFLARGARIVIAGGGAQRYDDAEVAGVRARMRDLPVHAFVSRDTYSCEHYGDLATHAYDGIDSAFLVPLAVEPLPFSAPPFVVVNFDAMAEPEVRNARNPWAPRPAPAKPAPGPRARLRQLLRSRPRPASSTAAAPIDAGGRLVLRTHHAVLPDPKGAFDAPCSVVSDLPSDYLSLYAHADTTYSDRVHACIATLAYGNRAQLFGSDVPRLRMFERLGAGEILERPLRLDPAGLEEERKRQIAFLGEVL